MRKTKRRRWDGDILSQWMEEIAATEEAEIRKLENDSDDSIEEECLDGPVQEVAMFRECDVEEGEYVVEVISVPCLNLPQAFEDEVVAVQPATQDDDICIQSLASDQGIITNEEFTNNKTDTEFEKQLSGDDDEEWQTTSGSASSDDDDINTDDDNTDDDNSENKPSNAVGEINGSVEIPEKCARSRRGKSDPVKWKLNVDRLRRQAGLEYDGKQKSVGNVKRAARTMGPPCNCLMSKKRNTKIKCLLMNEHERELIFKNFWSFTWDEKRMYVRGLVDVKPTKCPRNRVDPAKSRRVNSYEFHLKKDGFRVRVCKTMFLQTLAINEWSALHWAIRSKGDSTKAPKLKKKFSRLNKESRESVVEFFDSLPKVPSHYCRASTSRVYLEPIFLSKNALYREYKRRSDELHKPYARKTVFNDIMADKKISIYSPRKDQCDICVGYKFGNVSEDVWNLHITMKNEARNEKEMDKLNKKFVYTMDVEAVLLCPRTLASCMYFKMKLAVHNFTLYNLKTGDVVCYFWDETQADLTANVFASFIAHFINEEVPFERGDEIIFFSDGCTYQNRNVTMSNTLSHLAQEKEITIIQKVLEKGHTQMECDSVHAGIESQVRRREIYLPSGYVSACKAVRPAQPYKAEYVNYSFFRKYSDLQYYNSIRPGKKPGDPVVTDIRALKYIPSGEIFYKLRHSGTWSPIIHRKRFSFCTTLLPPLFTEQIKITTQKYSDLQDVKPALPPDVHSFYNDLPH